MWFVATATIEMEAFVPMRLLLAVALATASAVALLYAALGRRLEWPEIAWTALAHAPIVFVAAAIDAALLANPVAGGGWWACRGLVPWPARRRS